MVEFNPTSPLLVRDLMTVGVPTCPPDTPIGDISRLMIENGWEAIVVLDREEGHALGVVSQDDLVRSYLQPDCRDLNAEDVMRYKVPEIPPNIPIMTAAQIMRDQGVRVLFLMHHAGGVIYPAAMISYKHILRHLAAKNSEELSDLGINAERQSPLQTFIQKREVARGRNRLAS
jgi:CBS domain-containing protein